MSCSAALPIGILNARKADRVVRVSNLNHPRDPLENLRSGINDVLHGQREAAKQREKDSRKLTEIGAQVADTHAEVIHHGVRLDRLEAAHRDLKNSHFEHSKRLAFLEEGEGSKPKIKVIDTTSIPPPPAGFGELSKSGIHRFSPQDLELWQVQWENKKKAEELEKIKDNNRKIRVNVLSAVAVTIILTMGTMLVWFSGTHPHEAAVHATEH